MNEEIEKFIARFSDASDLFTHGQCYWFARILYERFHAYGAKLYYDEVTNHFVAKINDAFYDATGRVTGDFCSWDEYPAIDRLNAERIIRDCIEQKE